VTAWSGGAALVFGAWSLLWLLSVRLRDVSIVDVAWGPGFVIMAAAAFFGAPEPGLRAWIAGGAVVLWGLRLAVHLGLRARGRGEDSRYAAMREEHGDAFPLRSLVTVFWLQAALIALLSAPIWVAVRSSGGPGWVGWAGTALFLTGFVLETAADAQLTRFKTRRDSDRAVLDSGLWRYSRHPNYFGEAVLWWGFGLLAVDAGAAWTLFAPAAVTVLLLKVSGVPLLEAGIEKRRPGYADYVRRTPGFVPWLPRDRR
jgi:steroid 5-alpha reductase family enzyme